LRGGCPRLAAHAGALGTHGRGVGRRARGPHAGRGLPAARPPLRRPAPGAGPRAGRGAAGLLRRRPALDGGGPRGGRGRARALRARGPSLRGAERAGRGAPVSWAQRLRRRIGGRLRLALASDRTFVEEAYRGILEREADEDGLRFYTGLLREGHGRTAV